MKKYLLGIDRGTTNVKAAIYSLDGKEKKISSHSCEKVKSEKPGFAEQNMEQMWRDAACAIQGLWDTEIHPEDIAAVGLSGQGGGLFLVDEEGRPVREGIVSLDSRVAESARIWEREGAHKEFLERWKNGNPTVPEALLYWLKACEPESCSKTKWILQSKDWIRYKLTGQVYYEVTDASNGFLLDGEQRYSLDYLDKYGLSGMKEKFPELLCPWDLAGTVTEEAARATGLCAGTPVAAGGHDVAMVAFGTGCYRTGQLTTVLGTWGLNLLVIDRPHTMMHQFAKIVPSGSKDCYLMMNGGSTGAATEWFLATFCGAEMDKAKARGQSVFEIIEKEVLDAPDEGRSDIICHPFSEPPLTMEGYENAKFGFFGLTGSSTKAQVIRAFYEGIAIEMAMSLEIMKKAVENLDTMKLIGGGAASRLWGQMFADACGVKVEIMDIREAGCRGSALNAGIAAGIYADHSAVEQLLNPVKREYFPEKESAAYMQGKIKKFKDIGRLLWSAWV